MSLPKNNISNIKSKAILWINIISIFPEMFVAITNYGIISQAIKKRLIKINIWNPRNYTYNQHHKVDDRPYGGGPGMLMKAEPLITTIKKIKKLVKKNTKVIYLSPQGKKINQRIVMQLAKTSNLILICGRYKGIDERVIDSEIDEEWSIGDYIVSGGELPAMILIDALSRIIPGVLGSYQSLQEDSFSNGLLDCPQYTRPLLIKNMFVPPILLSGNHEKIKKWKLKESLKRTWIKRPDILHKLKLTVEQKKILSELKKTLKIKK
ncbi:MAG TPA: tRNA (guanosine(37)-N1)-methyltransferase TrmD [Buchnera sp. (in: enterobacteria)]|nr:tRNA (guanosine(37)-N1)-methyltransferase TrmD [Buchnera sp. (in: enterobacteria)]